MPPSSASNARLERQQKPLPWDSDMEESTEQPPHMILLIPCFVVYRGRRRKRFNYALGDSCAGASRIDSSAVAQ